LLFKKKIKYSIVIENKALLPKNSKLNWDQPFLNIIISGQTHLSPENLLKELKNIEKNRKRRDI
jgi:2-amino-4-hydroxy-6-hydroxymethyldihydropteridine diphosphokinase